MRTCLTNGHLLGLHAGVTPEAYGRSPAASNSGVFIVLLDAWRLVSGCAFRDNNDNVMTLKRDT